MKIGFPLVNENELAHDFAHSNFLGLYDERTGEKDFFPIVGFTDPKENYFFDFMVKQGLTKVASPFYSFMSLRVFKENNIETYKAKGDTIDDNIQLFVNGKMKPFDIYEALLTGDCAKDCASCSPESCEES